MTEIVRDKLNKIDICVLGSIALLVVFNIASFFTDISSATGIWVMAVASFFLSLNLLDLIKYEFVPREKFHTHVIFLVSLGLTLHRLY